MKINCTCGAPIDNTRCEAHDDSTAAANALLIFRQLTVDGKVDHKALLDEMERRNNGKPLPKKSQRTLAQMVAVYERSIRQ